MAIIKFNDKCFNYQVDVDQGRIWLENDATKQQWQWLSNEPLNSRAVLDGKQVPERVFFAAVKDPLRNQLDERADGNLTLDVEVSLTFSDWCAKVSLVLDLTPLEEIHLVHAHVQKKLANMEALAETRAQQHAAAAQAQQEEVKVSLSTVHQQLMRVDHQLTTLQTKRDTLATRAVVDRVEETHYSLVLGNRSVGIHDRRAWRVLG